MTHDPTRTVQFLLKMSLRSRILADPYYRFQTAFEIAIAADLGVTIDVNQAGIDDWLRLPGISIHQARQLVALSQAGVAFYSISDLVAALGIPIARLQSLAPILSATCNQYQSCHHHRSNSDPADITRTSHKNHHPARSGWSVHKLSQFPAKTRLIW
jgi:DNA uptake protein ComE-like DNA-binding protein